MSKASACPCCSRIAARPRRGRSGLSLLVCTDCGSERLDPRQHVYDPAAYSDAYFDAWNLRLGSPAWRQRSNTARLRLHALLKAGARGRLLDVGCAGGYLLKEAASLGFEPWGVEPSPKAARMAKQWAFGRVRQGTLEKARFSAGRFAAVTLFDVLEHHPQPLMLLREIRRVLSPGGLVALACPDVDSLTHSIFGRHWPHFKAEHLFYPSRRGLRILLEKAGFSLLSEKPAKKRLSVALMAPLLKRYPVPGLSRLMGWLEAGCPRPVREAGFWMSVGERFWICKKT